MAQIAQLLLGGAPRGFGANCSVVVTRRSVRRAEPEYREEGMGAWKRICCPVDFSAVSALALEEAAELSWRFGGLVTVLHVREPPRGPSLAETASPLEAVDHVGQLESWRERAQRVATTRVETALVTGDPAAEIIRFAAEGRYDVIVMGTHGRTGREKVAFGSVAQKVVLDAACPVLVVHPRISRSAAPIRTAEPG